MGSLGKESRDIIDWLSSLDFSATQIDTFARRQEGTGEWLLGAEIFKNWLDGVVGTLWCPGLRMSLPSKGSYHALRADMAKAGAGKTVLAYG